MLSSKLLDVINRVIIGFTIYDFLQVFHCNRPFIWHNCWNIIVYGLGIRLGLAGTYDHHSVLVRTG